MIRSRYAVAAAALLALSGSHALGQVATTLTYQGELKQASLPADGTFDFQFRLYDAAVGVTQVGPTVCRDNVPVTDGRFSVPLDFGAIFTGQRLYLEMSVRTDAGFDCTVNTGFLTIGPRQELTVAPFAAYAVTAATASNAVSLGGQASSFYLQRGNHTGALPSGALSGAYSGAVSMLNASNTFSGTFTGSGAALTSLNAANVSSGVLGIARGGTGRDTSGATTGQVLKFNGTSWAAGSDNDTDTTYTAGAGLLLSGTTFSVPDSGITGAMIFDSSIAAADIGPNAVGSSELVSDPISFSKVTGNVGAIIATNMGIGATPLATAKLNVGGNFNTTGAANVGGALSAGSITIQPATRVLSIPMMAFYPFNASDLNSAVTVGDVSVSYTTGTGADRSVYAPVYLPHGAVVTALHAHIEDASNTDLTVTLFRRGVDGSAGSTMASAVSSGNVAGTRVFSDTVIGGATVDNNTFAYTVRVDFRPTITNPNPPVLHGLRIAYTVTAPLP